MNTKDFENQILSLADRVYPMVRRMLLEDTASEDAVQDIMMKLWKRRKKLENHPNIPGFVFLTARNHCLDLLKKKKPNLDATEYQLRLLVSDNNSNEVEWKELNTIIASILKELPEQQAEVLQMRDIDGFEFAEIATALNLKIPYVRVLASRARKQVGIRLKEIYSYEKQKT
ncbi:sigma-70 family RNA polymerase sigma factor [Aggregatimonas sangjinii]|uniref:Sigma-70 family RNA polymerase sigma factor n=1 Tax=Aggregatimonas sangjinii TaxID=2583587 RepID=A0A5B7SVT7_9FLAO|nr:sigma-70 family RNA polymerase sigma factor [Aggregatimonas sangjinii]QCX00774.1 sigma-70 family RNA polymerase sigma factor [Aggregatimonas sangjinii]